MDYILKSRGRGKTYDLIVRSSKTGERIICASKTIAKLVNEKAKTMGLTIVEAMSYEYLSDDKYNHAGEKILIDELPSFLWKAFGISVAAITDTPDTVVLNIMDLSKDPECYAKTTNCKRANL